MTEVTFQSLGLIQPLLDALAGENYTTPTPIQAQAIPPLLEGRDLLGLAETGTGKTAAFVLPILQALSKLDAPTLPRTCRALILAPTRELAIQIGDSIATYGKNLNVRHTVIFGGVGSRPQIRAMDRGVEILVATPGRLLDLMGSRHVNLHRISHFVLDEADRMLDMGFIHDVRRIVKELTKVRQSLLFSATMPEDISSLAHQILHNPVTVEIARRGKTVDRIEQSVYFVDTKQKRAALAALLKDESMSRVIVFARTKHGADRVARGLAASGIGAYAIHGNKSQNARQAALESFRSGEARVLVATDIAARGIDIDDISHVVNYDLPNVPESYVHRIGRTARAGNSGIAISLCAPEERSFLRDIERLIRLPIKPGPKLEGLAAVEASLPPIPSKPRDEEGGSQHFDRTRGRVVGRRHMSSERPAGAWHEGDPQRRERRDDRAPGRAPGRTPSRNAGAPRGDRPPHSGDRPRFDKPREQRGAPGGERPHHSQGEKPRFAGGERPRHGGGERPRQASGDRPHRNDGARPSAAGGEPRRFDRPRGDGPRADVPRGADRGGDRGNRHGDRPPHARDGERHAGGEHRRFDKPRSGPPQGRDGDRPRQEGNRRPFDKSETGPRRDDARGDRPHQARSGDRPPQVRSGDRPQHARTGDRPDHRRDGDRRPHGGGKPQFSKPAYPRPDGSRERTRAVGNGGDAPRTRSHAAPDTHGRATAPVGDTKPE